MFILIRISNDTYFDLFSFSGKGISELGLEAECYLSKKASLTYYLFMYQYNTTSFDTFSDDGYVYKFMNHTTFYTGICIYQTWKRLSGTSTCPYHKSRYYDCYDCKYASGELFRECSCKERINTPCNERLSPIKTEWGYRCAYFKKCPWADNHKIEEEYFSK